MRKEIILAVDGLELSAAVFEAKETKALVQMIHGAKEHKERYYDFIKYLNENGFTVIISDNRGHGKSINEKYPLGYMDSLELMIDDQVRITRFIKELYPNKELYLFGHSFGSILARCYLQEHDDEIKKLVLSGTANYVPIVNLGIIIGKIITAFSGKYSYNKFLDNLAINSKDDSWLSVSQSNIEKYREDPLCGHAYSNSSVLTLLISDANLHSYSKFKCKNPELKILSVSGAGDPVTGGERGLNDTINSLRKIGYKNVIKVVYPQMKHEILNEDNNDIVYKDIVEFLLM